MAKNVLLLFSYDTYPDNGDRPYARHADILNKIAGEAAAVTFSYGALSELLFIYDGTGLRIRETRSSRDLSDFDMVFFQKWMVLPQHALAAATYLEHAGTPFISREVLHQNPVSKLGEMMLLIEGGLLYPKTVVGAISNLRHLLMAGGSPFSYPFIIKDISGSRGSRNYLVTDAAMLDDIESQNNSVSFMAQEFIANKSDYRITIVGGEIMYALERTRASDTHLNNTSQGGQGAFIEIAVLPQKMQDTALKAAAATGRLDFAGVDIIANGDEQYWVLEVNKSPEIQTGFGVDYKSQKLIDYFTRRLK